MIVLIDNYDSFTFNLFHYLGELGAEVVVHRNDKISTADVIAADPDAIVLSPGPCTPNEAGICLDLIAQGGARPSRSSASASAIRRSARPSAARSCARRCRCTASSRRSSTRAKACSAASMGRSRRRAIIRWWSSAPPCRRELAIVAETDDGLVMGLAHTTPAGAWRAVPSRKHRLRARPSHPEEFSRHRGGVERRDRPRAARKRRQPPRGALRARRG